jgi:hypothetical protein
MVLVTASDGELPALPSCVLRQCFEFDKSHVIKCCVVVSPCSHLCLLADLASMMAYTKSEVFDDSKSYTSPL